MNGKRTYLFVGGPKNGKFITIPASFDAWRVRATPEIRPPASAAPDEPAMAMLEEVFVYRVRKVQANPSKRRWDPQAWVVMATDDVTPDQAMSEIILANLQPLERRR